MKTTCITIHGVRSKQKGNWQDEFKEYVKKCGREDINVVNYKYGWKFAVLSTFPFYQRHCIKKFKKWLYRNIYPKYGNNIVIVAHSFGTLISYHALKDSFGCKILILFGGILHCREDFEKTIPEKIESCENFHSLEDDVCRLNPIGHSGTWGFRHKNTKTKKWHRRPYKNKKIVNHRLFLTEHIDYFPRYFPDILKLIA